MSIISDSKAFLFKSDEHFLVVFRYVERKAMRAGLDEKAEQWRWGSLWRWLQRPEPLAKLLSAWPIARLQGLKKRPDPWAMLFNAFSVRNRWLDACFEIQCVQLQNFKSYATRLVQLLRFSLAIGRSCGCVFAQLGDAKLSAHNPSATEHLEDFSRHAGW